MLFRLLAGAKENDIAAKRPARRAGRAAVDARRTHGEDKGPVRPRIARQRGSPVPRGRVWRDALPEIGSYGVHVCYTKNNAGGETNLSGNMRQMERPQFCAGGVITLLPVQERDLGRGPERDAAQ